MWPVCSPAEIMGWNKASAIWFRLMRRGLVVVDEAGTPKLGARLALSQEIRSNCAFIFAAASE